MTTETQIVPHNSPEYAQAVDLRKRILRWPLGLDLSPEELAAEFKETHLVATQKGKVIGCLVMVPKGEGVVKMRQVAVEPHLQGQGIGVQMVRASEEWARSAGFARIELSARDTAVPFYLKLDYALVGEPFEEVTIPHRKMMKVISPA